MAFLEKYVLWKLLRIRNESVGKGTEESPSKHIRVSACISENAFAIVYA